MNSDELAELPSFDGPPHWLLNPSFGNYTMAMPWYEREDFYRLRALADDRRQMTADYHVWHSKAMKVAQEYLARGQALQIVTIRSDDFLEWLKSQEACRTPRPTRRRYVEKLAMAGATGGDHLKSVQVEWDSHSLKREHNAPR